MTASPFAITGLPDDEKTRQALLDLVGQLGREGVSGFSFSVPFYDSQTSVRVRVVHGHEYDAAAQNVTAAAPNWDNLLSLSLVLDATVQYLVLAFGSCDMHSTGPTLETADIRVHDGTSSLNALRGSSAGADDFVPYALPCYSALAIGTSAIALTLDGQQVAPAGGNPIVERSRLLVAAIPVALVGEIS